LTKVVNVLADSAYAGQPFADTVREPMNTSVQIARRNEVQGFAVAPQPWVVERSFA